MIRIVVVDDSRTRQEQLTRLLSSHGNMQVIGTARGCEEALALVEKRRPDLVTIGHSLPALDGLAVTQRIMERCPVPIVIVTGGGSPGEVASTFDAVNAGALAVLPWPATGSESQRAQAAQELLQTVRLMSEVKVIRRWPKQAPEPPSRPAVTPAPPRAGRRRVVAIGASTGGPLALATILANLPKDFGLPVLVVQHMAAGFMRGFVDWLAPSSALPVHIATEGEHIYPGHVYMAPDGVHMEAGRQGRIELAQGPPENGLKPSVAALFRSVADVYGGAAAAVLLTGMGRDGASELARLRELGALTFAQDKESSIVHGMPGEAIKLGAAMHVLPPAAIAAALAKLSNPQ